MIATMRSARCSLGELTRDHMIAFFVAHAEMALVTGWKTVHATTMDGPQFDARLLAANGLAHISYYATENMD
jgi:hypothetical protein